jgi:hypothetical protein
MRNLMNELKDYEGAECPNCMRKELTLAFNEDKTALLCKNGCKWDSVEAIEEELNTCVACGRQGFEDWDCREARIHTRCR